MIKIRKLRGKDIVAIMKIMGDFPDSYPPYYVNSLKRGGIKWLLCYILRVKDIFDAAGFVLEDSGKIIGHIAYWKDVRCFEGGVYELRALVVGKNYQGKGYGEKLIKHAEKELQKIKTRMIWLQAEKKELAYYRKLGYKKIAIYKNYWGKNRHRFIMGKYLKT